MYRETLLICISMMCFAASPILIRLIDAPAVWIAMQRLLWACFMLKLASFLFKPTRTPWNRATIMGGVFLAFHFATWVMAIKSTSIAMATCLISLHPLMIAFILLRLDGTRFPFGFTGAMVIALLGVGLLQYSEENAASTVEGNLMTLLSAVFMALYAVMGSRARKITPALVYNMRCYFIAACVSACLLPIELLITGKQVPWQDPHTWALLLAMAFFPTILGHGLYNRALKFFSPTSLGLVALSEIVIATTVAWIWFGETLGPIDFAGCFLILVALVYYFVRQRTGSRTLA